MSRATVFLSVLSAAIITLALLSNAVGGSHTTTAALVRGRAALSYLGGTGLPARLVAADGRVRTVGDWPAEVLASPTIAREPR